MGLLSTLVSLPLAPLKGLAGLARHIQQQAEQERAREVAELQAELLELELRPVRTGLRDDEQRVGQEEFARKEGQLVERIGALAGARGEGERE